MYSINGNKNKYSNLDIYFFIYIKNINLLKNYFTICSQQEINSKK